MRTFRIVGAALLAVNLFMAGCTTLSAARENSFAEQALSNVKQIRKLTVYVVYDDPGDLPEFEQTLRLTSDILKKEIDVELELNFSSLQVAWSGRKQNELLFQLSYLTSPREREFDIAIGLTKRTASETAECDQFIRHTGFCWQAGIDNKYRRFIVMRDFHPWFLAHEIGHVFVFNRLHSKSGLMKPTADQADGGGYILKGDDYSFTKEDREEALRNKWRTFGRRVDPVTY